MPSCLLRDPSELPVALSELLAALSFALDLTEDAVPGHALRSCLLGMRLAAAADLPAHQRASLYYALLLKDIGCSSNAARMCSITGGDDRAIKAGVKLEDWTKPHQPKLSTLSLMWKNVLPHSGALTRALRIGKIALTQHDNNREMIILRCDRGASIIRKLGFDNATAEAVRSLDEHWNGSGYPARAQGEAIPLLARICAIAQHLDAFCHQRGPQAAIDTLEERSGAWFDPHLVRLTRTLHRRNTLWTHTLPAGSVDDTRCAVLDLDASNDRQLPPERLDTICEAFSEVVDAKSPFTFRHSRGVAVAAHQIALQLGLSSERVTFIRRAALLHDLGKLGVSNTILDKPGRLDAGERSAIEVHPTQTRAILSQVAAFREMACVAGEHHEKLDGTGYPDRRVAQDLRLESRVLAVADIYGALSEDRPYRPGMDPDRIKSILSAEAPYKIDGDCLDALMAALAQGPLTTSNPVENAASVVPPSLEISNTPEGRTLLQPLAEAGALYRLGQNTLPF